MALSEDEGRIGSAVRQTVEVTQMLLSILLTDYQDGNEEGWEAEFDWLETFDSEHLEEVVDSVREKGIITPVHLGDDGRIWDGHHRIYAAHKLGLTHVPVARVDSSYRDEKART